MLLTFDARSFPVLQNPNHVLLKQKMNEHHNCKNEQRLTCKYCSPSLIFVIHALAPLSLAFSGAYLPDC